MATRAETIQYIRSFNDVEDLGDGQFKTLVDTEGGRSQVVFMDVLDDLMVTYSPFATTDQITAGKAFGFAVIFGIALIGDTYCIRNVSLLADIDESEIVNMVGLIAIRADEFEKNVGGDAY